METTKQKTSATIARAAAPPLHVQRAAASVRPPSVRVSAPVVQPSLRVSSPSDPAEKEAESTARSVVRMSIPDRAIGFVRTAAGGVFRQIKGKKEDEERDKLKLGAQPPKVARLGLPGEIQRKAEGMPNLKANVASEIQSASAGGNPLPLTVRRFMEPRFKADFSAVKVHTGDRAAKLNQQLNAKAFAVGKNVFFGKDQFKPETDEGRELIAHELTHTIQQGAATQARRSEDVSVTHTAPVQVQRLGVSDALDYFSDKANLIPGFRMFTIVLGVNPVNMSRVDRSPANIMRAIIEFIPGGGLITQALDNYGVFDKVGAWVDQQLKSLNMSGATFRAAIMDFLGTLGWRDIFDLGGVWNRAKRILGEPVSQLISFAGGLVTGILGLIKDAILRPLASLAQGTRGYDLLKAILGRDPITGDPVPRNAETLIGGFMKLIGQEDVWENIKKGNAIPRAWAWFQGALSGLMSQVQAVPGKFMAAITSLTLADIVVLPRAFAKVGGVFLDIIGGFFSWAGGQVMKLLEIVFDVVSPGAMGYIKRVGGSLMSILRNPLPFVGNLVRAAKLGFQNFAARFGTHLRAGLIQWLTGSLPGIYIPTAFTLPELVKFVFSALGLTWANVRAKLVRAVGETAVRAMETGFDIVMTLVTQGPAAAWDKIKEQLGNLRDMVVGGITDMVVDAVVNKAVPRLVAMFIPGAGFITAILSIYDTVMVFVRQISRIIQVVTGFINSIVAIASGNIAAAATRVEGVLANLLSLAINFLAGFAGLGRVSDKVMAIFNRLRAPIDRALDALITWIVGLARRLGRYVAQAGVPNDPNERLRLAARDSVAAARRLTGRVSRGLLDPVLAALRVRYGLTVLQPFEQGGRWWVRATVNPTITQELGVPSDTGGEQRPQRATVEELNLLDDGTGYPVEQRRTLLAGVRGLTGGTRIVPLLLEKLRSRVMTPAQGLAALRRISSGQLRGGFRVAGGWQHIPAFESGAWAYAMNYYGAFPNGDAIEVDYCQRTGEAGRRIPVGWAYVRAEARGIGGSTPIPTLRLDLLVPVGIESLGIRGVGVTMFEMASSYFATRYQGVTGEWYRLDFYASGSRPDMSQNLVLYLEGRHAGESKEIAVLRTWTYRRVKALYRDQPLVIHVDEKIRDIHNVRDGEGVRAQFRPAAGT
jgi:hypothetical protein